MHSNFLAIAILSILPFTSNAQDQTLSAFPLADVRLMDGPFKQAEQVDLAYMMELEPDRLLAPFVKEAGLTPKAEGYSNWEATGLDGHTAGHYLSALAMMQAATGDERVKDRLLYMLNKLKECQDKNGNGYIGGIPDGKKLWEEIAKGNIKADNFALNDKWVPWYNIHKLYAGLRDAYLHANSELALDMLIQLTEWSVELVSGLTDSQIQEMLTTEYGGMNEVFADVAAITGEKKYLTLARQFSHEKLLGPLLEQQDQLNGMHANTQIPKVIGFKRIADVAEDADWNKASAYFWETVTQNRSVAIGGNSVREHFHPADDFTPMITDREGPETCNTYNMLRLSKMHYLSDAAAKYMDFYERGLYNHILASQHPTQGGFVYFTPMRPQHYRVYSQPETSFWCCVGSGLENHAKYGEIIYAHEGDEALYVNLFIPSVLDWKENGITLTQDTQFPDKDNTRITLKMQEAKSFRMMLRYPSWVAKDALIIKVNGETQSTAGQPGSYVAMEREWQDGDQLTMTLPMDTHQEYLPDNSGYFALLHGPIVLAAKTGTDDMKGLFADESRMGHIASDKNYPLHEAAFFISESDDVSAQIKPIPGKALTFSAEELVYPAKYKDLALEPFFRVHDARYTIYWQQATAEEAEKLQQANQALEAEKVALAAVTIDEVAPGEQQPESDHFYEAEGAESGIHLNRHWRHAHQWFSYKLKDENKEAQHLRLTYFGQDADRNFDILINGEKIATEMLDGSQGEQFFTVDYDIPSKLIAAAKDNVLDVKFEAHEGSIAGGIYYVRLLKTTPED